jgi:C_GCAxxG_C_C family probable redox protein
MSDEVSRRSRELFESGFMCAESVLLAVSEAKGVQSDLIPKIATGFCSGMGRTGGQCGALSGGILSIGLITGRSTPKDSVDQTYLKVRRLMEMFADRFEHTTCSDLLKVDLNSEEGQIEFYENDLIENCFTYTEEATRMVMTLLEDVDEG